MTSSGRCRDEAGKSPRNRELSRPPMPGAAVQPKPIHVDPIAEARFYIATAGTPSRARRSLKYGDSFIVTDNHGDIGASAGDPDGLFHADTRFLSRMELLLNEKHPLL